MTPEMWEAFAAMEGVPTVNQERDCCICGDDIDINEVHLTFLDMIASAHLSCVDKLLGELEERFYNK
jgi:hypothetical protein